MSAKKSLNWKEAGQFVAAIVKLFSVITSTLKEINVSAEVIDWVTGPGKNFFVRKLNEIGEEFLRQTTQVIMSLADMITLGKYDWVNSDINEENFPIDGPINPDEETKIFHFGREMSSSEVIAEMDKEGWKPAKIWHLLFFGAKNPELQKQFPIIALGSVWRGLMPYLDCYGILRKRDLDLHLIDNTWDGYCRFLAVRK